MNAISTAPKYPYGELWDTGWIRSDNLPPNCPENLLHFRVSRDLRVIGQGNSTGYAWYWNGAQWKNLGSTIGTNVGAFHPNGDVYISTLNDEKVMGLKVFSPDGAFKQFIPGYVGSNGIRYIRPDGTIVSGDVTYAGPLGIHQFTEFADVMIGQGPDVGAVVLIKGESKLRWLNDVRAFVAFIRANYVGGTYYIHIAQEAGAIAHAVTLSLEQMKQLPFVGAAPAPQNPTPKPEEPKPKPKPMAYHLSDDAKRVINAFVVQFPVPQATEPDDLVRPNAASDKFENKARAWTFKLAQQLKFNIPSEDWGTKNAGGGRPQSKDSIARFIDGRLINFDTLTGVGTGAPRLVPDPSGEDITGQVFMPVEPVNHFDAPVPGNPGNPTPVDPPPSNDLRILIAALVAQVEALKLRVTELESKPAVAIPEDVVRRGAAVEVTGSLSFKDVAYAKQVKWTGKVI